MQAPGIPYDWSIFTVNVNAVVNHFALRAPIVKQTWRVCEILLAPVVQKVDSAIHRINLYPLDSAIGFPNIYPMDSQLSGG